MICPRCLNPMHQALGKETVGGESTDEHYITWTILSCPTCGRVVKEYYEAEVIDDGKGDDERQT